MPCRVVLALLLASAAHGSPADAPGRGEDGGCTSTGCLAADASLLQLPHTRAAANRSAECALGCCEKTCSECMRGTGIAACRWCPETQSCHHYMSMQDKCAVPINSLGQCWGEVCPYRMGGLMTIRPDNWLVWAKRTLAAVLLPLQSFSTYDANEGQTGIFDLTTGDPLCKAKIGHSANVLIALASDWGTGTCEARVVSRLMEKEKAQLTIHLGDVYYVGAKEEFATNVLGKPRYSHEGSVGVTWPKGSHSTFFMGSNHEILAGNTGLVKRGFRYTGQNTTYAVWQSANWRIIALDTGYKSYKTFLNGTRNPLAETDAPQPQEVIDWLVSVVKLNDPEDKRGIILLTHHQPFSDWEHSYLGTANQLEKILPAGKTVVWFFGHEHRLALYSKLQLSGTSFYVYPRMIGNGGFPQAAVEPKRFNSLVAYDKRVYQEIPNDLGGTVPVGFNGYFKLHIRGPRVDASYITGKCKARGCVEGYDEDEGTVMATETITVDPSTGDLVQEWTELSPLLTRPPNMQTRRAPGAEVAVEDSLSWPEEANGTLFNLANSSMD